MLLKHQKNLVKMFSRILLREGVFYLVTKVWVSREAGAAYAVNYHIVLRLNGEFYGLYTYLENDDNDYLQVQFFYSSLSKT